MLDQHTNEVAEPVEETGFLEDVENRFNWSDISPEGWICLPIFWALAGVVFWQFFTRYVLNDSAVWTEEIARQLLILLTFYGAGYALQTQTHICISYFTDKLGGKIKAVVAGVCYLLELVFYTYSCLLCLDIAKATQFQKLMAVDLSKATIYQAVALSFAAMAVRSVYGIWQVYRSPRLATPPHNPVSF